MNIKRVIPVLLLQNGALVKTIGFGESIYIGDPLNTIKILNDKNIPELIVLDIDASANKTEPDYKLIALIAAECDVPLIYGGGIQSTDDAKRVFDCGVEKVSINSGAWHKPDLINSLASRYGSQSVVVSMDVNRNTNNTYIVYLDRGKTTSKVSPIEYAKMLAARGCGEILLNNISRDGTRLGYDLELIKSVSQAVNIPVIALGGANSVADLEAALKVGASAAAAGSMFTLRGKHRAVLISFPEEYGYRRV